MSKTTNQEFKNDNSNEDDSCNRIEEKISTNDHLKVIRHSNENQQIDDFLSSTEQLNQPDQSNEIKVSKKRKKRNKQNSKNNSTEQLNADKQVEEKSKSDLSDMNQDQNEDKVIKINEDEDVKVNIDKKDDKNVDFQINTPANHSESNHKNLDNAAKSNETKPEITEDKSNDLKKVEVIEKELNASEAVSEITNESKPVENSDKVNGKQSSTKESNKEKVQEILRTENNLPNDGNKLVIFAILIFKFFTYFIIQFIGLLQPARRNQLPSINEPLLLLTASEITQRIKNGQVKCEHVIRAYIHRIEAVQPKLNAIIDNCFEDAIKKAKEIDEQLQNPKLANELKKLPLLGVPFTCKDSVSVKGLVLTAGVKIRKGIKADEDATVIKNLRLAGAIPLAITNTPELVLWYDSENTLYGRTNNPYDLSRIPGGSSGGEGSLIAAAGSLLGVGTDVGGSIRIPSMFNGVFGHKTTFKYVPIDGMFPKPPKSYQSFLCFGPITRYASDLSLMLKAMGGQLADELRLDDPVDFRKIKIYYQENDGNNPLTSFVDQRIINSIHQVVKYFKKEYGIEAEKININKFKYSLAFFGTVSVKDELTIEDYVSQNGKVNVYWELLKSFFGKSDITRPMLIQILNQSSPYCDPKSSAYKRFTKMLAELKPKIHDLLSDNAVLIMPTWPTIAPKHKTTILRGFDAAYTMIMNSLEIPATHCPVGLTKEEGLPLGLTVAAGPAQDHICIAFAKEIEKVFKGWVPPSSSK